MALIYSLSASGATVKTRVTGAANWNTASTWIQVCTGTTAFTNGSATVTGTGTFFTTELQPGDVLMLDGTPATVRGTVSSIESNTSLTLTANATATASGAYGRQRVPDPADDVVIGNSSLTAAAVTVTLNVASTTVNSLTFTAMSLANSLTHSGTNSLAVTNNVTVNQPTANAITIAWNINAGSATVGGNVAVGGTNNTVTRVAKISVTTGSLSITGSTTLSTGTSSASAEISVGSGSITYSTAVNQTEGTCTFTGAGTIRFNAGFSFASGGSATPVFTTVPGANLNFGGNLTVSAAGGLTLNSGSNTLFNGSSTITPTTAITFGNLTIGSGVTAILNGNITVNGNWTNNGGTLSGGSNTVTFSGATIGGTASTEFPVLSIAAGASSTLTNDNSCSALTFVASGTATSLTHSGASALTVNGPVTMNQPTGGVTFSWNINAGSATVSGLITFAGINATVNRIARIVITTGTLNANGGITFTTSASATKVIDMSGGAGTLNLKGALTVPANSSTLTAGTSGSIFNYADDAPQTINFFSAGAYRNLRINNTSASGATLSAAITTSNVTGNLRVLSGTLDNGGFAIAGNAGGIFEVADGATFRLAGTSSMVTGFGTTTLGGSSTVEYIGTTQTVAVVSYGNLITGGSGTKTLAGNITPAGNLSVTAGTFDLSTFTANRASAGGTLTVNDGATMKIGGTNGFPSNYSTRLLGASSTVEYGGTTQTVAGESYGNLTISGSGTKTLAGNTTPAGNLSVNAGTLDLSTFTAGRSAAGGTLTVANGATLKIGGTNSFPANYSTRSLGATSTVEYSGTSQTVSAESYGHLTLSGSGTKTMPASPMTIAGNFTMAGAASATAAATITFNGSVILESGSTFNASSFDHSVSGDWTNNGGTFVPGTGTITFSSTTAAQAINGTATSQPFNNLTINKSGQTLSIGGSITSLTISGDVTVSAGTLNLGSATCDRSSLGGALTVANGATLSIGGTNTLPANYAAHSVGATSTITYAGASQSIGLLNGAQSYGNLTLSGSGTKTFPAGVTTILGTHTVTGVTANATTNSSTINYGGAAQTVVPMTYYNLTLSGSGAKTLTSVSTINNNLTMSGTATATIATAFSIGGDLTVGSGTTFTAGAFALTVSGTTSISGSLSITSATGAKTVGNVIVNSGGTWSNTTIAVTITGNLQNDGTFTSTTGVITFSGTTKTISGASGLSIPNTTINGTYTNTGTLTVATALSGSGTLTQGTSATLYIGGTSAITNLAATALSNTVEYTGAGAQTVKSANYFNLTLSGAGTATLGGTITVGGDLLVSAGTLALSTFTADRTTLGGTLTVGNGVTLNIGGTNTLPANYATHSIGATSTITYSGSSQAIGALNSGQSYGNLTLSGSGTKAFPSGTTGISGTLTVTGVAIDATTNSSTVEFNGSGAQTIAGATYYNLSIAKSAGSASLGAAVVVNNNVTVSSGTLTIGAFAMTVNGTTSISGTLSITSATGLKSFGDVTVNGGGTWSNTTIAATITGHLQNDGTFTSTTGVITFSGTTKTIGGASGVIIPNTTVTGTYTNTGTLTVATALSGAGTLTQGTSATLYIGGTSAITNLIAAAIPNTVEYNGTGAQTIKAANYYDLIISGARTGANNVTLAATGTIGIASLFSPVATFGTGGYVITGSTIDYNGSGAQSIATFSYNNLTLSNGGVKTFPGGTTNIAGNFEISGSATADATTNATTINFNGTGSQAIASTTYPNFTKSAAGTATLSGTVTINGDLTVSAGTLALSTFTAHRATSGGTLTVANGATLSIGGTNSLPANYATQTIGATSTVEYVGTAQTVTNVSYGNLTLGGSGTKTIPAGLTLSGTFTMAGTASATAASGFAFNGSVILGSGTTFNAGSFSHTVRGDWTNNGATFTPGSSTITFNNTAANQSINGTATSQTFYNITVDKTGRTLSVAGSTTTLVVNGTVTLTAGIFSAGTAATITVGGDWTNNGATFTPGTGTVTFNSTTAAQVINGTAASKTYNNITVDKSGQTLSIGGGTTTLTVNGTVTLTAGTFAAGTATNINVGGSWTNNGGTFSGGASTVTFTGTSTIGGTNSTSFPALTITTGVVTMNNSNSCSSLTFSNINQPSSLTLNSSAVTLTVNGDVTINQASGGGNIHAWNINAGSATVTGSLTLIVTALNGGRIARVVITTGTLTVQGDVLYNNTMLAANSVIDMSGGAGTLNIGGNWTISTLGTLTSSSTSTVVYNGTDAQTVGAGSAIAYNHLTINKASGTATLGATATVDGNLTLASGTLSTGASNFNLTVGGDWTNNGGSFSGGSSTVTFSGASKTIGGTTGTDFPALFIAAGASYTMNNDNSCSALTFAAGATASSLTQADGTTLTVNGTVTLNHPTANNITAAWNINAATATVSGVISFPANENTATRVARIVITTGTLNANGGIAFSGTGTAAASRVIDMSGGAGIVNLKGALTFSAVGTLTAGTSGSIFNYADNVAQTINFFTAGAYRNLRINNTSASGATLSAAITTSNVTGNLRVLSGTLDNGGFAIAGNAGGIFEVADGATFRLAGTTSSFPTGFGTVTLGATSTVEYSGTGAQTIAAQNYGHLTITGSRSVNNVTLQSSGTIGVAGTMTNSASFSAGNGFVTTGSTVDYNGSGPQSVIALTPLVAGSSHYNNLSHSGSGVGTLTASVSVGGSLTVSGGTVHLSTFTADRTSSGGTLTVSNGTTLKIGGTGTLPSNYSTHSIGATSTIEYAGTTTTVAALNSSQNYGTLTISGTGVTTTNTFSVATALTVNTGGSLVAGSGTITMNHGSSISNSGALTFNNLAVAASATVSTSSSFSVGGTLTVSPGANLSPSAGTMTMNGSSITGGGTLTFSGLTIGTAVSSSMNFAVNGTLTLNNNLAMGSNTLTMGTSATTAGTADVTGNVKRSTISAATAYSFGNPSTTMTFAFTSAPAEVTMNIAIGLAPTEKTDAIHRVYGITVTGGSGVSATLRLHYLDAELNANTEEDLTLWTLISGTYVDQGKTGSVNTTNKWVELANVTVFSNWTLASTPLTYFSRTNGSWNTASTWSTQSHTGPAASKVPGSGTGHIVTIGNGHTITLDVNVTNLASCTVISTGTLNTGTFVISGTGTFVLNSGGTIGIGSAEGISSSGSTGSIQTSTREFGTGANYTYTGSANQATGNGLPSTVNDLTINNGGGTVTLTASAGVAGNLLISSGTFDLGNRTVDRASSGGTLSLVNGTTLRIGGTGTFPANYTTHSIGSTSTIEYAGTTQSVATLNSSQTYGHLIISSAGTKSINSPITTAGDMTIHSPATLSVGNGVLIQVGGNLVAGENITNNGTIQVGP